MKNIKEAFEYKDSTLAAFANAYREVILNNIQQYFEKLKYPEGREEILKTIDVENTPDRIGAEIFKKNLANPDLFKFLIGAMNNMLDTRSEHNIFHVSRSQAEGMEPKAQEIYYSCLFEHEDYVDSKRVISYAKVVYDVDVDNKTLNVWVNRGHIKKLEKGSRKFDPKSVVEFFDKWEREGRMKVDPFKITRKVAPPARRDKEK